MRLQKLEAHYFRGFQEHTSLFFDSDLVIFYGDNGSGKTSLAEAIEWLLYGTTRRQNISATDKTEHRGALVNVKCPEDETPFVEGVFAIDESKQVTIRRELFVDGATESTTLKIDGTESDLSNVIDISQGRHHYPVIVQENLQTIVNASGQQRRDHISQMLGLQPLVDLENGFRHAARVLENNLPDDVESALREFRALHRRLEDQGVATKVTERWGEERISPAEDWASLVEYCCNVCDTDVVSPDAARTALRNLVDDAVKQTFDYSEFEPPDDADDLIEAVEEDVSNFRDDLSKIVSAVGDVLTARAKLLKEAGELPSKTKRTFLKSGLKLLPDDIHDDAFPLDCPFCNEQTFTSERLSEIDNHLQECVSLDSGEESVSNNVDDALKQLDTITRRIAKLTPQDITADQIDTLRDLLPDKPDLVRNTSTAITTANLQARVASIILEGKRTDIRRFPDRLSDVTAVDEVEALVAGIHSTVVKAFAYQETAYSSFRRLFRALKTAILQAATSDDRLQELETVEIILDSKQDIAVAATFHQVLKDLKSCRDDVSDFREEEEKRRLRAKGTEITHWFNLLYPADPDVIDFSRADPRGQVLRLYGSILGEERHAATHFSQSQATCLGLALHIIYSVAKECPFDFMVFDDPIQSFDAEHRDAFYTNVLDALLDKHGKQIVLLTHIESFATDTLNRNLRARSPRFYRITEYDDEGIQFRKKSSLRRQRDEIRRKLKGAEDDRDAASKEFTPFTEKLVKALYHAVTEEPLPPSYRSESVPKLLELFDDLSAVTSSEIDTLQDSWNFGTKPRHDDPEQSRIPARQELERRIEEVESIAKRHGVLD